MTQEKVTRYAAYPDGKASSAIRSMQGTRFHAQLTQWPLSSEGETPHAMQRRDKVKAAVDCHCYPGLIEPSKRTNSNAALHTKRRAKSRHHETHWPNSIPLLIFLSGCDVPSSLLKKIDHTSIRLYVGVPSYCSLTWHNASSNRS